MKGYQLKNGVVSLLLSLFFLYIARKMYLDYTWFLIIYMYVVCLLMGHITANTIKPEKEIKVAEKSIYQNVSVVDLSSNLAPEGSVDAVLTFRNLHNWLGPQMDLIFANSYKALKAGGVFVIVEHRANPGTSMDTMKKSGYVTEAHAIMVAKKHGFTLVAKSEINANNKDTKDYPKGVWTLPPNLRLKNVDREKYLDIGESDRMTLLFKKL